MNFLYFSFVMNRQAIYKAGSDEVWADIMRGLEIPGHEKEAFGEVFKRVFKPLIQIPPKQDMQNLTVSAELALRLVNNMAAIGQELTEHNRELREELDRLRPPPIQETMAGTLASSRTSTIGLHPIWVVSQLHPTTCVC